MSVFSFVEHLESSLAIEHFCDVADILYSLGIHHWLFGRCILGQVDVWLF